MTEDRKAAIAYLTQALGEYASTLQPSVRGPFLAECQKAVKILEGDCPCADPKGSDHG